MTIDTTRSSGDEAPQPRRSGPQLEGAITGPHAVGVQAASKFIGRVSQLDIGAVKTVVETWHQLMRAESDAWFAAEMAAARAVRESDRAAEQEVLLGHMADCVLNRVWYRPGGGAPEEHVGATEASGQYVASVAMLALLVRDFLAPRDFALLYAPFARFIPLEAVGRE